jgi:hypothetical protein
MTATPGVKSNTVLSANDLKPLITRRLRNTQSC